MTMQSRDGFIFGLINAIGNFGAVFVDQSYTTAAIAARPSASWKSYLLGGALWFSIPFAMATSLGLASRAAGVLNTLFQFARRKLIQGYRSPLTRRHKVWLPLQLPYISWAKRAGI
jgi:hypothetical protein